MSNFISKSHVPLLSIAIVQKDILSQGVYD